MLSASASSCVRSKTPWSSCHSSRSGRCCNIPTTIPSTHVSSNQIPSSTATVTLSALSAMCPPTTPDPVSPSPNVLPPSSFTLPLLLSISCVVCVFTLQHVPKGAHDTWSGLVTTELNSILSSPSNMNSWRKFMMLAKCILVNPSGRHFPGETFKNYKDRVKRWFEGDFTGLWAEVIDDESKASHKLKKSNSSFNSLRSNNAHCACRAVQDGLFSKAIQALSSNGLAKATLEVRDELLMKHPQAPPPQLPVGTPPNTAQISDTTVLNCLKSFLPGSAPGPTDLRANHLKEAILCPTPSRASSALQSISKIVNLLCSGQAPPDLMPHLCGATLLASQKKDGGHHPIAVGEVLRWLVSKCLTRTVYHEAANICAPLQVGVCIPVGAKVVVHIVSSIQNDHHIPPSHKWTLLQDFSKAFNSIACS